MSFFGFGDKPKVSIKFRDVDTRDTTTYRLPAAPGTTQEARNETLPLFDGTETVSGTVLVERPKKAKKCEHQGIKIELIGQVELAFDRGNHYVFTSLVRELEPAGDLQDDKKFDFEFANVEKQYETYNGLNVRLRYFVKVTMKRAYSSSVSEELDFAVQNALRDPQLNPPLKMEVGIEDCLHIEFEYERSKYHLKDILSGQINFLLVRIKIKHMELQILKRESTGSGPNLYNETEVICKYEIMDGAPVKDEKIPIRLFLSPYALTPTFKNVHNKFSVKYYINLVLVDEEDRRYFKQQEIHLRRKELTPDKKQPELPAATPQE